MTTKEEVVQYIKALAEQKIITKEELNSAYDGGSGVKSDVTLTKKLGITEIIYYIGGGIVFLGICIMVWQNWSTLGTSTKILVTLGSGIAAYIVGVVLSRNEKTEPISSAFFLISALVTPMGFWVLMDNAGIDPSTYGSQSIVSGVLLATYVASSFIFRKNIFTLFSILYGTWFFFSITSIMMESALYLDSWKFYQYRLLITGLSYILLGYSFSKNSKASLKGFLYSFGIIIFLGSALALGGWDSSGLSFWEIIYPVLVFGALYLSVHIKSRSFLTWGTIFLMIYILKITGEYFTSGLGWPLALVLAGLAMIGVGYMSVSLRKKYLITN